MANPNSTNNGEKPRGYGARLFGAVANAATSDTVEGAINIANRLAVVAMALGAVLFVPALVVAFAGVVYISYTPLYNLGYTHFAEGLENPELREAFKSWAPLIAAATSALPTLAALGLLLFARRINQAVKGLLVIVALAWTILLVLIAFYERALTFQLTFIPPALTGMGAFLYAALPALGLIPTLFGLAAARNMKDNYTSVFHASGHIIGVMLEGVALIAGMAGEAFFGLYQGLDATFVVPAALVAGFMYLVARAQIADAKSRNDDFDRKLWGGILLTFGVYIGVVVALSVQELSAYKNEAGLMVERLSLFPPAIKKAAEASYQLVMLGFILASIAAEFLARRIHSPGATPNGKKAEPEAKSSGPVRDFLRGIFSPPPGGGSTVNAKETPAGELRFSREDVAQMIADALKDRSPKPEPRGGGPGGDPEDTEAAPK